MTNKKKRAAQRQNRTIQDFYASSEPAMTIGNGNRSQNADNTASVEKRVMQRVDKRIEQLENTILNRLNQMTLSHSQAQPGAQNATVPKNAQTTVPQVEIGQEFSLLYEGAKQQSFMQAHSLMKPLYGNEGRSKVESYFRMFESMTHGWGSRRQANLLAPHLEGQARLSWESLGIDQQQDYDTIKHTILNSTANTSSLRAKAQSELMRGMRQGYKETLLNFGLRILRTTRDSMLPETPEDTIEDVAAGHLLNSLTDPTIHSSLALLKDQLSYHELLDKAVMLKEMKANHRAPYEQTRQHYRPQSQNQFQPPIQNSFTPMNRGNSGTYAVHPTRPT